MMKSNTIILYKEWLNSASQDQIDLVDAIYHDCEQHYDAGGDTIVECFEPKDILEQFKSTNDAKKYCGLKVEQASNARWGEDSDPEIQTLRNFEQW
jgi:hypothetical protein